MTLREALDPPDDPALAISKHSLRALDIPPELTFSLPTFPQSVRYPLGCPSFYLSELTLRGLDIGLFSFFFIGRTIQETFH